MTAAVPVPRVAAVSIDDRGLSFRATQDDVVDVCFDGRRIWSFWLLRDSEPVAGGRFAAWPSQLTRFLQGTTQLSIVAHVADVTLYDAEVGFGAGEGRVAVVDEDGRPLGLDKSNRISQTFDTRTPEQVVPLLDSIEAVLAALKTAGVEAFPAYGTLLGAVRNGALIGHDSDADLGYVSKHSHPVDAIRESFELQRRLTELGFATDRYSGMAFKVDIIEADGASRGLDVFGGYIAPGVDGGPPMLYLMGEVGAPFEPSWIYPLGTTTLDGRTLPAPAQPEKLLEATYGPGWRVPDPAYQFTTPRSTVRRLDGWFRGQRAQRNVWERRYGTLRTVMPPEEPSALARFVLEREGVPPQLVDLGAGRGADSLWFARQGAGVVALDFVTTASGAVQQLAAAEGLDLTVRWINLVSLRSWLAEGARLAWTPGPRVLMANQLIGATNEIGRAAAWQFARMALRDGGRLYLEFWRGEPRERTMTELLSPVPDETVVAELVARGAVIVHRENLDEGTAPGKPGRPTTRLVAEWPT
ncbi:MAG: Methyltransferase type 11 [Marmoricola sp.]|nr:Methyltransferase type 11 [Marmoricola sp.]